MKYIGIAINKTKDNEGVILNLVINKIKKAFCDIKIDIFDTYELNTCEISKEIEILIVLGGDGTLLGVSRKISNELGIPLLGINIGNLGFLSSIDISEIDKAIFKLKNNLFKVEERMLLKMISIIHLLREMDLLLQLQQAPQPILFQQEAPLYILI